MSYRVVFGVIGNDIHVVANRIIDLTLQNAGFLTCNLGTNNRVDDFIDAAIEVEPHAVLVSSINGEAETWCANFRPRFRAAGISDVLLYLGGTLVIGEAERQDVERKFLALGFDRVFYRNTDIDGVIETLKRDIERGFGN